MAWKLRIAFVTAFVLGGGLTVPNQALAADQVPFKGSDVGHFVVPDSCAGGALHVVINGSGRATHLGRYSYAANECFDGFYASRRNYDVAQGRDTAGHPRSGVLEQSWRAGGASCAEMGALEAFRVDPSLRTVRATTREVYGEAPALPADGCSA